MHRWEFTWELSQRRDTKPLAESYAGGNSMPARRRGGALLSRPLALGRPGQSLLETVENFVLRVGELDFIEVEDRR